MKPRRLLAVAMATTLAVNLAGFSDAALQRAHAAPAYNLIMNWFPEPEVGGFYEAQRTGLYTQAGINTTVEEYGYSVVSQTYVLTGKAAFGMANADEILQYRAKGAPLVAIMATYQTNDQGLMWHAEDTSIKSLADLSNHTLVYTVGAGFEPYLVQKYHYTNFKTHQYDFTLRYFAQHKDAVNQIFATSEPYQAQLQHIKVKYALNATSGYDPYGDIIYTTESMIKNHPGVVKAFVTASVKGWNQYLKSGAATNAYLETQPGARNYPLTPGNLQYSYTTEKRLHLIDGGDARTHGIGYMSLARWKTLQQQMVSTGLKVGGVDVTQAFTDQFLPKM